jgi:hypothetical protein
MMNLRIAISLNTNIITFTFSENSRSSFIFRIRFLLHNSPRTFVGC